MGERERSGLGKMRGLRASELDALLRRPIIARLACVRPDGAPHVVPIWQEWDGAAMWFIIRERAAFVPYLRADPRLAVSCALDEAPGTRALLEGVGEFVAGPVPLAASAEMLAMAERMAERYGGAAGLAYLAGTLARPRYWVRLRPEHVTSWEGAEWPARYRA